MRTIDLFCGAGGSSWGARLAGAEIVGAFDAWELAGQVFKDNFPEAQFFPGRLEDLQLSDVAKRLGDIDLMLASPECTNHGPAKGNRPRCERSKNTAFQVTRFASALKPRWIAIENVSAMRRWDRYQELINDLTNLGYRINPQVLNSAQFGVPQRRRRLFLLCDLQKKPADVPIPSSAAKSAADVVDLDDTYDVLILDLKDESDVSLEAESNPAGLEIFAELKQTRFIPVIFYTALAHKVRSEQTSFVRVVEKTEDVTKVRDEVRRVISTGLPALTRRLEEIQRSYMWDFVSTHWKDFPQPADQSDVAYLLARRLAITLETTAGELAANVGGLSCTPPSTAKAHPMIMYVVPSIGPHPRAGDVIAEEVDGNKIYWLILTPSCDFAQSKADHFTMVRCERLADREEFKKWSAKKDVKTTEKIEQLIEDKRGDRYKFLPGTFFIPDLVADFQQLRTVAIASMKTFTQIATVDSPFAESIVARFSRYFNRLGTPDLDKSVVIGRLESKLTNIPPKQ